MRIMQYKLIVVVVLLVLLLSQKSNAFSFDFMRRLVEKTDHDMKPMQMSTSPSPAPSLNSGEEAPQPVGKPSQATGAVNNKRCGAVPDRCSVQNVLIACWLPSPAHAVLVQNDGEISLKVNLTILPMNDTYKEIEVLRHEAKEINVTANVRQRSTIVITAGDGKCVISMASTTLPVNFYKHGAFALFASAVILGGAWTCYKLVNMGHQHDGIAYKELEMGQSGSLSSSNVETADGWDQGWDDDWDEEKAVKSHGRNYADYRQQNGLSTT